MLISKLLRLLLLILACAGTIRLCAQQDSGRIILTFPEFDYYAKAVVEREHLGNELFVFRAYSHQLLQLVDAQDRVIRQDSIIKAQKSAVIVVQQGMLQQAATDLNREQRRKKLWRVVAVITGATSAVLLLR